MARRKELASAFGWTLVRIGIVPSLKQGCGDAQLKYATRENITIAPHTDMSVLWAEEEQLQETMLHAPHAFLNVASFDPSVGHLYVSRFGIRCKRKDAHMRACHA